MASPKITAKSADLASMGPKALLVEGQDDWHSFSHMIHESTGTFPTFELGYCGNDDRVLDILTGMTEASTKTQTVLGAVLDADRCKEDEAEHEGIQARIRSLQGRLGKFYSIPAK